MSGKLVKCKTCGKDVAYSAFKCPHCGQSNPSFNTGKGCMVLILAFVALTVVIGIMLESGKKTETETKLEFPFTIEKFIQNYNQSFLSLGRTINVSIAKENDNGIYFTTQLKTDSEHIGLVVTSNNKTRMVKSITFIGTGDGTPSSGVNIIFGLTAVVMAIENHKMPVEQRGEIVSDLGLSDGRLTALKNLQVNRKGVLYSLRISDDTGIWLIAEQVD